MKIPGGGRLTPAQGGWLLALLVVGWIAFLFVPRPKPPPAPLPPFEVSSPSKLEQLGLPDNPDLRGLPEFFRLLADHAEWRDNRTFFAYWHPGANAYAYFVESSRAPDDTFRFRLVSDPSRQGYVLDAEPIDESPLKFFRLPRTKPQELASPLPVPPPADQAPSSVPVKIEPSPIPTETPKP